MRGLIETPVPTTSATSFSTELSAEAIELSAVPSTGSASEVLEAESSPSAVALAARRTVSRSDCWPHSTSQSRVSKGKALPSLTSSVSLNSSRPSGCFSFHADSREQHASGRGVPFKASVARTRERCATQNERRRYASPALQKWLKMALCS